MRVRYLILRLVPAADDYDITGGGGYHCVLSVDCGLHGFLSV